MKGNVRVFLAILKSEGLPEPVAEFKFHPTRKWRFDFSWPEQRVFLEVDGALFSGGRHARPLGILAEHEKFNAASVLGWRPLRCTPQSLLKTETINTIKQALAYQAS